MQASVCEKSKVLKSLHIESQLLIERSLLRWVSCLSRIPEEWLLKQTLDAEVSGKRPVGRSQTRWLDYI